MSIAQKQLPALSLRDQDLRDEQVVELINDSLYQVEWIALDASGTQQNWVRQLTRADQGSLPWCPTGTVLVTDGTGKAGKQIALWLARNGAQHLVLTSDYGANSTGATALVSELISLGMDVTVLACDMTDPRMVSDLLSRLERLTAVVHSNGTSDYSYLTANILDGFTEVVSTKR